MKSKIFLSVIACVLISDTLAFKYHQKADNAHSDLMYYVQQNMDTVPMMRGLTYHLECYNGFLPLINSLATKARDVSNGCVITANFERDQELAELKNSRLIVAAEVDKITKSLIDCSDMAGLDYFLCLENNAETNRKLMETIKESSKGLLSKYNAMSKQIDHKEQSCIMRAVDIGKAETNQAFVDLKSCIRDGPVILTQIGDEEIESAST
ncbi:uncharacterized protein LOC129952520 [Eupeodes corollae]|uniref:uncharacterized protein LOC129952520 n=1 Tax=Eupeodes corollae TaxID=290404 RepID=UPI002493B898|nr:uncharacterized protein LOC129952520 [Eupeodes corollae]